MTSSRELGKEASDDEEDRVSAFQQIRPLQVGRLAMTVTANEISLMSAAELSAKVRVGDISALEVTAAVLRRIEERARGNAFITTCPDYALRQAARKPTGPLAGVPLAVKDMFDTAGIRTTYGSSIFRDHVPTQTALAVAKLEAAGAILVGKANQHEFAWGVTSQNPHWGTVANPVLPGKVAGGSSGGNAAALADGLCTIGLGTDTGGSVRIPAACCGVVGFKPPFGIIGIDGTFPLAPSFDTVGPMARSVRDCVLVYSILTDRAVPVLRLAGLRIGVLASTGFEDELAKLGALVEEFTLPKIEGDPTAVFMSECAITHVPWFPSRRSEYGPDAQFKWDAANNVSAVSYHQGLVALEELQRWGGTDLAVDVLVSPTLAMEPPAIDCWEPNVRERMTQFTRSFNFLGWPAIAIGNMQLAGPNDATVLGAALAWEESRAKAGRSQAAGTA